MTEQQKPLPLSYLKEQAKKYYAAESQSARHAAAVLAGVAMFEWMDGGIEAKPCKVCDGEGRVETDNNGPIVDCWVCHGMKKQCHYADNLCPEKQIEAPAEDEIVTTTKTHIQSMIVQGITKALEIERAATATCQKCADWTPPKDWNEIK